MSKPKVPQFSTNRTLHIRISDKYWSVLWGMSQMQGREPEDVATERLKQIIIEDVIHGQCDEGMFGKMLLKGWEETLLGDPYFESVTTP